MTKKEVKKQNKFLKVCYLGSVDNEKAFDTIYENFSILEQKIKAVDFISEKLIFKKNGIIESECYNLYLVVPKNIDNDTINEAIKPYGLEIRSVPVMRKFTITDSTEC